MLAHARTSRGARLGTVCRRLGAAVAVGTLLLGCKAKQQLEDIQPFSLTTGVVRGRVLDQATGQGITGASVHLVDRSGADVEGQTAIAYVNPDGEFTFPNVNPGTYRLRAEAPNHEPETSDEFAMDVNTTFSHEFKLRPRSGS